MTTKNKPKKVRKVFKGWCAKESARMVLWDDDCACIRLPYLVRGRSVGILKKRIVITVEN